MKNWIKKNKWIILPCILLAFAFAISFKQILDRTQRHRTKKIEYLVVHWTANTHPGADASANAYYLRNKKNAGTHYCIDDEDIYQCTLDKNVAYAVGGPMWRGFSPKFWLAGKILNNNSLSFEMCLGGGRNDSIIIDWTASLMGKKLVEYGLDVSRIVRHHDANGKPCPRFMYATTDKWDQVREDSAFLEFRKKVDHYYQINLFRKKIWKETREWIDTIPPNVGTSMLNFKVSE
jgi:N-acetylmuramoyl-L-alanine amidase CwlA